MVRKLKRKDGPSQADYANAYHGFGPPLRECPHCYAWSPNGYMCNHCGEDPSVTKEEDDGG